MVWRPSLTVTVPVGCRPPATVTFTALADPKVEGSGRDRRDGRGQHLAGGDLDVVDAPAVDATATVAADCEAHLDRVAERHAGSARSMIEVPQWLDLATVGAGEAGCP